MSEIKRITGKAREKCALGRANPAMRKDDGYVVDLIYLLEESTRIILALCEGKSVVSEEALTIAQFNAMLDAIEDEDLQRFFAKRVAKAANAQAPKEPLRIAEG